MSLSTFCCWSKGSWPSALLHRMSFTLMHSFWDVLPYFTLHSRPSHSYAIFVFTACLPFLHPAVPSVSHPSILSHTLTSSPTLHPALLPVFHSSEQSRFNMLFRSSSCIAARLSPKQILSHSNNLSQSWFCIAAHLSCTCILSRSLSSHDVTCIAPFFDHMPVFLFYVVSQQHFDSVCPSDFRDSAFAVILHAFLHHICLDTVFIASVSSDDYYPFVSDSLSEQNENRARFKLNKLRRIQTAYNMTSAHVHSSEHMYWTNTRMYAQTQKAFTSSKWGLHMLALVIP